MQKKQQTKRRHNSGTLNQFQRSRIILRKLDPIVYPTLIGVQHYFFWKRNILSSSGDDYKYTYMDYHYKSLSPAEIFNPGLTCFDLTYLMTNLEPWYMDWFRDNSPSMDWFNFPLQPIRWSDEPLRWGRLWDPISATGNMISSFVAISAINPSKGPQWLRRLFGPMMMDEPVGKGWEWLTW